MRAGNTVGRYGGEEFAVLLPQADAPTAERVAERLRAQIAALILPYEGATLRVTASVGVSVGWPGGVALTTIIHQADMALYAAKAMGRNQVQVARAEVSCAEPCIMAVEPGGGAKGR